MTHSEIRALLRRADPAKLRQDAGIRRRTVAEALGVSVWRVMQLENDGQVPQRGAGVRWAEFTAGLLRHAEVTAEIAATERRVVA